MWILNWLPDVVFHLILVAGVLALLAGFVFKFIPFVKQYQLPIQVVGIILTILGVWYEGGIAKDAEWKARVAELETKVAKAEAKSAEVNTKVVTKVVTKLEIVRVKGDEVIKYVDREIVKYDTKFGPGGQCEIPKEFIKAHNQAAEAPKGDAK
jgi:uncharacterized coiled-coil protein SlyX